MLQLVCERTPTVLYGGAACLHNMQHRAPNTKPGQLCFTRIMQVMCAIADGLQVGLPHCCHDYTSAH